MKLVLAVSADGFVARGPDDDMSWTGPLDKFVFKLLTMSDGQPLLAGRKTFDALPPLPGRRVIRLTRESVANVAADREHATAMTLFEAAFAHPEAWVIGGPTLAEAALFRRHITRAFICRIPGNLHSGMPFDSIRACLPEAPNHRLCYSGIEVDVYTGVDTWPGK